MWRNYIFKTMTVSLESDVIVPKPQEDMSFKAIYRERVIKNPKLNLQVFLNRSMIFKVKMIDIRKSVTKFNFPTLRSEKLVSIMNKNQKRAITTYLDE